jgi:hypothetical protein
MRTNSYQLPAVTFFFFFFFDPSRTRIKIVSTYVVIHNARGNKSKRGFNLSIQPSLGRLLRVPSPPIDDIYEFPWKKEMMKRERHGRKGEEDEKKDYHHHHHHRSSTIHGLTRVSISPPSPHLQSTNQKKETCPLLHAHSQRYI